MSTPIAFCCNDYRNGHFAGTCDQIRIDLDCTLHLEGPSLSMSAVGDSRVRIGRRIFGHAGWASWVGNWCWDELRILDPVALLLYLHDRGWKCDETEEHLYDVWNAPSDADELREVLSDWLMPDDD